MNRRQFLFAAAALTQQVTFAKSGATPDLAKFIEEAGSESFLIRDLYNPDRSFSDLAKAAQGNRVTFTGFMAPPLKAEANFFVLTKMPMATCPFCEPDAEWPDDILPVYTKRVVSKPTPFNVHINATGVLEMGKFIDPETGFYSLIRLVDSTFEE